MIDVSSLTNPVENTTVDPSDNIFKELGKNTYDFKDLISELIDNSIAARQDNVLLKVAIELYVDQNNNPIKFIIRDNAKGISPGNFGVAICPAGLVGGNSLNEHGLGMKQAVAALGDLSYLATKTKDEEQARVITCFKYGNLPIYRHGVSFECGTEICVKNIKPIVTTNSASITKSLVPYLGARYRRFLKPDRKKLDLSIAIINDATGKPSYTWQAEEVKITYFHPSTRKNEPIINRYPIDGNGWNAELTFGYAPQDVKEYEELGVDSPNKFHPYNVSLNRQGLDLIRHDRVIRFHQLSEIGIVAARHSDYNHIRGEIDLLKGFTTAITKNSIIDNENFRECIKIVGDILLGKIEGTNDKKKNYLKSKTYPEQIPEKLLRDRLAIWLENNPLQKRKNVDKEYVVDGIEGYIDILADEEVWELKTDQASALDVYQLFMYMDIKGSSKGYLVANSFSGGANIALRHIKDKHKLDITLTTLDQFPITHPPTQTEREEYY